MSENKKIFTKLVYDGEKTISSFDSHSGVKVAGLTGIEEKQETWSSPHMFLSSIESCFLLTLFSIAEKMRVKINKYSSNIEGTVYSEDGRHFEVKDIIIKPKFELENPSDTVKLKLLCEKAEEYCLVARSIRPKVNIEL